MFQRFVFKTFLVLMVCALLSCGGSDNKTTAETTTDTSASFNTTQADATSAIVTTPQYMMIVRHKVVNYAKWKTSYEAHDSFKLAHGLHNYVVGQSPTDQNMLLVALRADDVEKAKAFGKSTDLKNAMKEGGVVGAPIVNMVRMVFQDTGMNNAPLRSMTTFPVKNWASWQTAFAAGEQERLDHGIAVRAYGHEVEDSNKVVLVTAILDTAKAYAYYKSDMLKKRREASGAIGEPERFLFNVLQRYR